MSILAMLCRLSEIAIRSVSKEGWLRLPENSGHCLRGKTPNAPQATGRWRDGLTAVVQRVANFTQQDDIFRRRLGGRFLFLFETRLGGIDHLHRKEDSDGD